MEQVLESGGLFRLPRPKTGFKAPVLEPALRMLEELGGLGRCRRLYASLEARGAGDFVDGALEALDLRCEIAPELMERIPRSGAAILVANHPFGAAEGLALLGRLRQHRGDVRVVANHLLGRIPGLRPWLIAADPFGGSRAARANLACVRESLRWLAAGGLLVLFPAGEVASFSPRHRTVLEASWSRSVGTLVRRSGATLVPLFFPGRNSLLFQAAGLIHPRLRTALLVRELLNKRGRILSAVPGRPIEARRLLELGSDEAVSDHLRARTALLGRRAARAAAEAPTPALEPLCDAVAPRVLEDEIAALPPEAHLLESGPHRVYLADAARIPWSLREIGRLRELSFRAAGEGTGSPCDLDAFDAHYQHLFLWHCENRQIVGAYRIAAGERILAHRGPQGFYCSTLFEMDPALFERLPGALELGRSFVRPECQRSYAPLLLLWKGIGAYLVRNPRTRYLFGPVSISRDYSDLSRQLMVAGLGKCCLHQELAPLVRARDEVRLKRLKLPGFEGDLLGGPGQGMERVSELVADLEPDGRGVPVLLRQYLGLGGRLLAFNLDRSFSDVIDALLLVDLHRTEPRQLQRYLGRQGAESYLEAGGGP